MKQFKLEVSHATPQQLATIALELKIMANGWTKHGTADHDQRAPSFKLQA